MNLYFGSTSTRFLYGHYLAILSAIKTQHVDNVVMVCTVQPPDSNPYFKMIKDKIIIAPFMPLSSSEFPMLRGRQEHFVAAATKDYIEWLTLYENGGIFIDLDTFSIKDMSQLLGDWDVITTPSLLNTELYEAAVVIAKRNSVVIKDTLSYTIQALKNTQSIYTATGPQAFTKAVRNHKGQGIIGTGGIDSFGPRIKRKEICLGVRLGGAYIPAWLDMPAPDNSYILHMFAASSIFNSVDKDFIRNNNSMYARTVRNVLSVEEWDV